MVLTGVRPHVMLSGVPVRSSEFETILTLNKTKEKYYMDLNVRRLCQAALIAAVYTVLSLLFLPISFGPIQCRISEMLVVLPAVMPAAVWGVTIGCLITNILGGAILPDVIFGTAATLIGAVLTRKLTKPFRTNLVGHISPEKSCGAVDRQSVNLLFGATSALPPIVSNTIIVPLVLKYAYAYDDALLFMAFTVCIGEVLSAGILGNILLGIICRRDIMLRLKELDALG